MTNLRSEAFELVTFGAGGRFSCSIDDPEP